ncbi:MAG TPA: SDR family oxidoreductase [Pseudonocardiaceae bacterium]|jgi:hypothetical protein|nr:SDR family oxidoreductase [Pseudonocardiaceae bacterium]
MGAASPWSDGVSSSASRLLLWLWVRGRSRAGAPRGSAGLMATALDAFGRLDTVVANAGVQPMTELATMSVPQWRAVVEINLIGSFATVQAAASAMGEWITGQNLVVDGGVSVHPTW